MQISNRAPYCGLYWGSLEKKGKAVGAFDWWSYPADHSGVVNVRAGRHDCFDRMVVDLSGVAPGFRVRYLTTIVKYPRVDGVKPEPIAILGGAFLEVTVPSAAGIGRATTCPAGGPEPSGRRQRRATFRQIVEVDGAYESFRLFGLGVRARLPFRVFTLPGPGSHSRLVIDVAYRW